MATPFIINDLPALPSAPDTGDELPIERGTDTYKIDYNALATAIINKLGGNPVTIAHGGTGATTASAALAALGGVSTSDTIDIAHGGTGATTASAARTALAALGTGDVVNNLTSTATKKPLSAAMGNSLNKSMLRVEVVNVVTSGNVTPGTEAYVTMPLPSDSNASNTVYIPICCVPQNNFNAYATVVYIDGRTFTINAGGSGSQAYRVYAAILYTH